MNGIRPTPLSENGSFEKLVNAGTGYRRMRAQRWCRRMLWLVAVLLAMELGNIVLWIVNVFPPVLSICISEVLTCAVSFVTGQIYVGYRK